MALTTNQVLFRRGTQNELITNIKGKAAAQVGTFYFTTDTHRLYMGIQGTNTNPDGTNADVVPVNEGVISVSDVSKLPTTPGKTEYGVFYYAIAQNILCVNTGSGWVQINPDTDRYYKMNSTTGTESGTNTVKITSTIDEYLTIPSSKGQADDSYTTEKVTGNKLVTNFEVEGKNGIVVTVSEVTDENGTKLPKLSFSASALDIQYTLSSSVADNTATIKLDAPGTEAEKDSSIIIKSAGENVTITSTKSNEVIIDAKDTRLDSTNTKIGFGNGITGEGSKTQGIYVKVQDTNGTESLTTIDPVVNYGEGLNTPAHIINGEIDLNVYTIDQINSKLKAVNAMVYKGTVGDGGSYTILPTSGVSIGDTFKASSTFEATIRGGATQVVQTGDLLIANSDESEDEDGHIQREKIIWEYVPSGNEDTQYKFTKVTNGINLVETTGAKNTTGTLIIDQGTDIVVEEATGENIPTNGNKLIVSHNGVTREDTVIENDSNEVSPTETQVQATREINVITGVTTSSTGHVTGVTKEKFILHDTNGTLQSTTDSVSVSNNTATISNSTFFKPDQKTVQEVTTSHTITSSNTNLQISVVEANEAGVGTGISLGLFWDTF